MASDKSVFKVGFGPQTEANSFTQSGVKVAEELLRIGGFECGYFRWEPFDVDELLGFDVLVFIKYIPELDVLKTLRRAGKIMVLDYQDTFLYPSVYEENLLLKYAKRLYHFSSDRTAARRFALLDGCFIATPLLADVVARAGMRPLEVPRQIYNDDNEFHFKEATDATHGVVLYWTGVSLNQPQNDAILPALRRLKDRHGCRVVYDTDQKGGHDWIEYRTFDNETWPREMLLADIAFRWRDTSNMQHFKDPNKVLSYMAAGLPAVIHPTASERLVVRDGETGFFADTVDEFERIVTRLVLEPELRRKVGKAAHAEAWEKYSLRKHVACLRGHLLQLMKERG
jgi:glycosyltransferase involved in cell wall biosynthesis